MDVRLHVLVREIVNEFKVRMYDGCLGVNIS